MTTQSIQAVLINGFGVLFVLLFTRSDRWPPGASLTIGKLLARPLRIGRLLMWALVIDFVVILLFIGYLLTLASSIPGEIKVGLSVTALCRDAFRSPSSL